MPGIGCGCRSGRCWPAPMWPRFWARGGNLRQVVQASAQEGACRGSRASAAPWATARQLPGARGAGEVEGTAADQGTTPPAADSAKRAPSWSLPTRGHEDAGSIASSEGARRTPPVGEANAPVFASSVRHPQHSGGCFALAAHVGVHARMCVSVRPLDLCANGARRGLCPETRRLSSFRTMPSATP